MNDPVYDELLELTWRRQLTAAEEARLQVWLAAHPEAREEWEAEAGLNRVLARLPEAPAVSSNFTALVLQGVEREAAAAARRNAVTRRPWVRFWMPRAAFASLIMGVGFFAYSTHVASARRALAQSTAQFSQLVANNQEVLEDFDAIDRLKQRPEPEADRDLLALLQ